MFQIERNYLKDMILVIDQTILKYGHLFSEDDLKQLKNANQGLKEYEENFPELLSSETLTTASAVAKLLAIIFEIFTRGH